MANAAQIEIERLLDAHGVVERRRHPELARPLSWLAERGRLTAILSGTYVRSAQASDPRIRILALTAHAPDAVLTRQAAASLSFWPEIRVDTVTAAVRSRRVAPAGFCFEQRRIAGELVNHRRGAYLTNPALTALDLVPQLGGDAIDHVLRVGAATLADFHRALELSPNRRGNQQRHEVVNDSRDQPWARSERLLHRLLRAGGLVGWDTNIEVLLPEGRFSLDAAFAAARVAIEVDGWEFHARRSPDFDKTMRKHSALESAGWRVLHFTWSQLVHEPDWVLRKIVQTLAQHGVGGAN